MASSSLTAAERLALSGVRHKFAIVSEHGFDVDQAERLWSVRHAQLTAERLQPYNDLLFKHLMDEVDFRGAISAMMEKIKTSKGKHDLCVPIWEYKHCEMPHGYRNDVEYMPHINAVRAGDSKAMEAEVISSNGWRGLVGATQANPWYGETDYHYPLQDIDFIFRKTDLKERLALEFGGEYFSITIHRKLERETIEGVEYYPMRCSVMLEYYPQYLPNHRRKLLGVAAVKYAAHVSEVPSTDVLTLENGTQALARRMGLFSDKGRL